MNSSKLSCLALLLGISLLPAAAKGSVSESDNYPYFSPEGRLVYLNTAPGMSIHGIKTDGLIRPWVLYERDSGFKKELYLGRITAKGIVRKTRLSHGLDGWFHSPDMDLAPTLHPWAVWVQVTQKNSSLSSITLRTTPYGFLITPTPPHYFRPRSLSTRRPKPGSSGWVRGQGWMRFSIPD